MGRQFESTVFDRIVHIRFENAVETSIPHFLTSSPQLKRDQSRQHNGGAKTLHRRYDLPEHKAAKDGRGQRFKMHDDGGTEWSKADRG